MATQLESAVQNGTQPAMPPFAEKMGNVLNSAAVALMTSIGHRTGLFDTMATMGPADTHTIAERAGLSERYVREWLGAMVTGGIVTYDPKHKTYSLPPEHAEFLTRNAVPNNIAAACQWISVLGGVEDEVVKAFEHGQGVPYSAYKRFHEVMAEESGQTVLAALLDRILPLVPELDERLKRGINVLDVGCGSGRAMNLLARHYPNSRFTGYDLCDEAVRVAREDSSRHNTTNTTFDVRDMARIDERDKYDLVTAFDAIHDQARPDLVLANIHRALKPGGIFLMQDIGVSTHLHHNMESPIAPFVYTISCMHCMSVSLANQGMGLGAAWGKEKAMEMLAAAGFENVRVEQLDHDMQNYYYVTAKEQN